MLELLDGKVKLKVKADSPFDEIFLIDGGYNLVAKGVGTLEVPKVDPGLYKLKYKSGDHVEERSLLLNKKRVEVQGPRIEISSPVPLSGIAPGGGPAVESLPETILKMVPAPGGFSIATRARAEAIETRRILNPSITKWSGAGSELYFYLATGGGIPPGDLISSLRLLNEAGDDLKDAATIDKAALTARVYCAPGFYRLRVNLGELGEIELPLYACKNFRTAIFLSLREFGVTSIAARPDLPNAGVLMRPMQQSYEAIWEVARLTEKTRMCLQAGRAAIPTDQTRDLLRNKAQDPMNGIMGAHLLLLEKQIDLELFQVVVRNLSSIVGNHPDVKLLRLWSSKLSSQKAVPIELPTPPMLAASWLFLDDPWMKERVIIPENSMSEWVGSSLWGQSVWLLWRANDFRSRVAPAKISIALAKKAGVKKTKSTTK